MTTPNQNPLEDDERGAALGTKLLAESKIGADNQIIILGLVVVALLALGLGWRAWQSDSDDEALTDTIAAVSNGDDAEVVDTDLSAAEPVVDAPVEVDVDGLAAVANRYGITATNNDGVAVLTGIVATEADKLNAGESALAVTGITSVDNRLRVEPPEVEQPAVDGDALAAAVSPFDVSARLDGTTAILEGIVPTDADSASAEAAAAAVAGVTSVDNRLTIIQPAVVAALTGAGVDGPEAIMDGRTVTVRGTVPTAADAAAAVEAAGAVDGVEAVIDELTVLEDQGADAADELNKLLELNPIQFATSSAVILDASFATLDEAATYLSELDSAFEIQGYTDVRGSEDANLALSQARADSVRQYLIDKGIAAERLTAVGYGETTQFAEGDSDEALAANRRVRFEAK